MTATECRFRVCTRAAAKDSEWKRWYIQILWNSDALVGGILAPIFSMNSGGRAYFQPSAQEIFGDVLADGIALLTYATANEDVDGNRSRHTLRSSVWVRTASGWQIRFHQGTPTSAASTPGNRDSKDI